MLAVARDAATIGAGAITRSSDARGAAAKPNPNAEPETILLWPDGAPGALGTEDADRPTLTVFRRAASPSGRVDHRRARRRLRAVSPRITRDGRSRTC